MLRPLDAAAIIAYLTAMIAIGIYFSRRNNTTEEYFVGNRSFSGWVIGLSMLGTIVSSATFLALPAAAYVLDWRQLAVNLVLPFVAVLAVLIFIPFFRRGKLTSAFEYLGLRFGAIPRIYGTVSFILLQMIRMAQILFLVSIPIQFLTGVSVEFVVIGAGVFIAFYTIAGGIEAVVWTDVVQALVLMIGCVLCFVYIVMDLPGGVSQILEAGAAENKFSMGSFDWDLNERTFWTVAILGIINWLAIYSGDQNMVQRYLAARSTREARKATIIYSAIALPMWTMFFFIGTALFVYYQSFPDPTLATLETDQILPYFILTRIPAGLAGLIVAAVMAAAMSSLDSGINSISTVVVVDLMRPHLSKKYTDLFYLRSARTIAMIVSVIVVSGGIAFSRIEKESMNDISLIVTSLFGGCLMGLFMMGFFTRRIDGLAATLALIGAVVFNAYLGFGLLGWWPPAWTLGVHSYWIGALVNLFFAVTAYALSWLLGASRRDLTGLTIWTMEKEGDRAEQSVPTSARLASSE
ncbi:sodium/solute symporter [Blastopirellula sp. J2-11]|uniref:sodium:solute symporter family transporter n=1 Tax=Blastopirellula sp. J2-11 TaxID=2943192 RepID=UPI0021C854B1|nr:sodium/solute symporter [Blastopirellula sp. J2-11]UUO07748.1 sodium/solute symporter [Blastopirellula sp. J2-11]